MLLLLGKTHFCNQLFHQVRWTQNIADLTTRKTLSYKPFLFRFFLGTQDIFFFRGSKFGINIALNFRCKSKIQTVAVEGRWNHVYDSSKPVDWIWLEIETTTGASSQNWTKNLKWANKSSKQNCSNDFEFWFDFLIWGYKEYMESQKRCDFFKKNLIKRNSILALGRNLSGLWCGDKEKVKDVSRVSKMAKLHSFWNLWPHFKLH